MSDYSISSDEKKLWILKWTRKPPPQPSWCYMESERLLFYWRWRYMMLQRWINGVCSAWADVRPSSQGFLIKQFEHIFKLDKVNCANLSLNWKISQFWWSLLFFWLWINNSTFHTNPCLIIVEAIWAAAKWSEWARSWPSAVWGGLQITRFQITSIKGVQIGAEFLFHSI